MKIRLDRTMYTRAQRIADAKGDTFAVWSGRQVCCYCFDPRFQPKKPLDKLTRSNSVSVAVHVHADTNVTAQRVRECIALGIEEQDRKDADWPYRHDRSTLEALQTVESMLNKRTLSLSEADQIMDKLVAQRKEEIRVSEMKEHKK
jgi:hypothetical protein